MEKKYIYDAFISYRHTELDKFVAENLHKQLEAFKLPGNIAKKKTGRTKIERIFRDKDELPLTNNLEDPIMKALQSSEYLIVICSPRLRESLWCKKEIETFIKLHGREKVLAVLIEGEPNESFPEELLYGEEIVKHPDGTEEVVKKPMEPLAADIRGKNKKEMLKAMRTEMLRLLAPMFSLTYDDLRQRHKERRMKRILTAVSIGAAICLLFGAVSTAMALRIQNQKEQIEAQNAEIQAQNDEIQLQNAEIQAQNEEIQTQNELLAQNQAIVLAGEANRQLEAGDRIGAIHTAVMALTEYEGIEMPYTAEAQYALTESLRPYDTNSYIKAKYQIETVGNIEFIKVSCGGEILLTGDSSGALILWDLAEGFEIYTLTDLDLLDKLQCNETKCTFLGSDKVACIDEAGNVIIYCIAESAMLKRESALGIEAMMRLEGEPAINLYADEAGEYLLVETEKVLMVYRSGTWELLTEYTLEENTVFSGDFFFDEEGLYLAFGEKVINPENKWSLETESQIRFLNLTEGTCSPAVQVGRSYIKDVCYADGKAFVLYSEAGDDINYHMTVLFACNPEDSAMYWQNRYEGELGNTLVPSYAEGVNRVLMITTYSAYAIERADGSLHGMTTFGSSIVGSAVYVNRDMYILFTRDGKYFLTDGDTLEAYNILGLFQCRSDNVEEFLVAGNSFLIKEYLDNKVTYYQYSVGSGVVPYEGEFAAKEEEWTYGSEAVAVAQEYGIPKAELTSYIFYNEDGSLLGICYTDSSLEIYQTSDKQYFCGVEELSGNVQQFAGTDAAGNFYVMGISYGYMFSPDGELLAEIEGLVSVDVKANQLILKDRWENLLTVPIYTVEELLAKAETYVLR